MSKHHIEKLKEPLLSNLFAFFCLSPLPKNWQPLHCMSQLSQVLYYIFLAHKFVFKRHLLFFFKKLYICQSSFYVDSFVKGRSLAVEFSFFENALAFQHLCKTQIQVIFSASFFSTSQISNSTAVVTLGRRFILPLPVSKERNTTESKRVSGSYYHCFMCIQNFLMQVSSSTKKQQLLLKNARAISGKRI